jgi:ABC-type sugar transport system ATPase subunit
VYDFGDSGPVFLTLCHAPAGMTIAVQTSIGVFEPSVELAEALGHEQLLHLRVGGATLTVRGAPGERPAIGSVLRVQLDQSRMHLFDRETGVSLRIEG